MAETKEERAMEQAKAQYESIAEMVAALECDYDRLEELRDERKDLTAAFKEAQESYAAYGFVEAEDVEGEEKVAELVKTLDEARDALEEWDADNAEELKELEAAAGECKSEDEARERIQEDPLSLEVRSDWTNPGETMTPGEFCILLCTGGPAARIVGDLDERGEPYRARLEYQDWFTPWAEYMHSDGGVLLTYARCFCFAS